MIAGIDFIFILICAVIGAVGQAIRVFLGIYKIVCGGEQGKLKDVFSPVKLVLSVALGALSGILVWFLLPDEPLNKVAVLLLLSAGYAGSDFIEGVFKSRSAKLSGGGTNP